MDKFGASFITREGPCDGTSLKEAKLVGLLFGAAYCEPFNRFLPNLIEFYNQINGEGDKALEILYFPFDQKQSQFLEYFQDVPWISYEFKDPNKIKYYLEYKEHIQGIPALLILHPEDGTVLTNNGRGHIEKHGLEALETWQTMLSMK